MPKLAAWSMDRSPGDDGSQQSAPKRVERSYIELEKHLEDWIVKDVTLIGEGLTLVGQQVKIDDGRLDLLAIDSQDRWVVIEIKPGMLDSGALTQALYYASSIARLDPLELRKKIETGLGRFGDAVRLSERVNQQLKSEGEEHREIAVMLVGAGVQPGLERMNDFLGRFGVPISVVSFEVFELDGGPQLLIREVMDEMTEPSVPKPKYTVDAIRQRAADAGVGTQFDRLLSIARAVGLPVRPYRYSVNLVPPADKKFMLMYASPTTGVSGGQLYFEVGLETFSKFFPHMDKRETVDALGELHQVYADGKELDEHLDRIEQFLARNFPELHTGRE
ncbi:MAG: endonuclease NucS [Defluviicoccus sp.]|nr:endonuclease NucS [Defluviicoccus sp.]MDE0278716.1 endonuclease NucS [Defluviicoccus sp.]